MDSEQAQALNDLQQIILQLGAEGDHVRMNQLVQIGRVFRNTVKETAENPQQVPSTSAQKEAS